MSLNIQISKDNYKILQVEEQGKIQYIGSRYCQKREIDKFIDECLKSEYNSIYVIFGLGFGEHIKELLKYIGAASKILIIELNKELIQFCCDDSDIKELMLDRRISVANDAEEVKKFFYENIDEINIAKVKLNYYCRYDKIYGDKLHDIYDVLRGETERITTNRNTILHFGEEWTRCMINNLQYISSGTPVNKLKNKYRDVPAVIVSAGPSLEKNIDLLKNFNGGLILSGGRTLKPLVERNIKPDLLCVMDSGEVSYKLVADYLDSVNCPLVFSENSNSDVVSQYKGKKIFSANNDFISDICGEHIYTLSGGGSVAHSMTLLASYMGCNPIIFIGQDLAYTGEKGHASFAKNTWQNMTFNDYKRSDDIYIEDINGEPVRTSIILNRYRIALQNIIKMFPNINYINATEGGANIEGTQNKELADVLSAIKPRSIQKLNIENGDYGNKISVKIKDVLKNISEYEELYYARKDIISKMDNINYENLDDIERKIKDSVVKLSIINNVIIKSRYDGESIDDFKISYDDPEETRRTKAILKNSYIYELILQKAQEIKKEMSNVL